MITYYPCHVVSALIGYGPRQHPRNLLPLYERFARRAVLLHPCKLECLNDTSGINDTELHGLDSMKDVHTTLAVLFSAVGTDSRKGQFLASCGIRKWTDLAMPIQCVGWDRPFPFPQSIRERKLRLSWNSCHPEAIYGQYAYLRYTTWRPRWSLVVKYGYSHDTSSWSLELKQKSGESLRLFGQRATAWIDELFEPDTREENAGLRDERNRAYDRVEDAVKKVFWDDDLAGRDERLRDMLLGIPGACLTEHRMRLTPTRLAVLRRWIRSDKPVSV